MHITKLLLTGAALAAAAAAQPCLTFASSIPGVNLGAGDDTVHTQVLPFAFPFNGGVVTSIDICSNGFVWLGTQGANPGDFSPTEAEFLADPARIAVSWRDWNAATGGAVFYKDLGNQVNIVWKNVPAFGNTAIRANMELVLTSGGDIVIYMDPSMNDPGTTSITGISAGGGAVANPIDLSAAPSITAPGVATGYEVFAAGGLDLAGANSHWLLPSSATDYAILNVLLGACPVATTSLFGKGCPGFNGTGMNYELFPSSTFDLSNTNWKFVASGPNSYVLVSNGTTGLDLSYAPADVLTQGDDTIVLGSTASMNSGAGFPFNGGNVASVELCSNGFVWMGTQGTTDFSPTVAEFNNAYTTSVARIAPLWMDLNFNAGGVFYWTTTPTYCMATWENAVAFGTTGTSNSMQVKFHANGDIDLNYGSVVNNATTQSGDAITGISAGQGSADLGSIDFGASTGTVFSLVPAPSTQSPLNHFAGSLPVLGTAYQMVTDNIPTGAPFAATVVGFTTANVDLTGIGMPGCRRYLDISSQTLTILFGATTMTKTLNIPNTNSLNGLILHSQGVAFAPPITPLGAITSNRLSGTLGL